MTKLGTPIGAGPKGAIVVDRVGEGRGAAAVELRSRRRRPRRGLVAAAGRARGARRRRWTLAAAGVAEVSLRCRRRCPWPLRASSRRSRAAPAWSCCAGGGGCAGPAVAGGGFRRRGAPRWSRSARGSRGRRGRSGRRRRRRGRWRRRAGAVGAGTARGRSRLAVDGVPIVGLGSAPGHADAERGQRREAGQGDGQCELVSHPSSASVPGSTGLRTRSRSSPHAAGSPTLLARTGYATDCGAPQQVLNQRPAVMLQAQQDFSWAGCAR